MNHRALSDQNDVVAINTEALATMDKATVARLITEMDEMLKNLEVVVHEPDLKRALNATRDALVLELARRQCSLDGAVDDEELLAGDTRKDEP